ncbi:MAG: response regulator [Elusimicrobia bacterium]|nr:response regulator [Elusimicrobiota bacterium]
MNDKNVVLLVEDDEDDARLTQMALEDLLDPYEVVVARDGVEALDYLLGTGAYASREASKKPLLIILDINLPRIDGLQLLERLNQEWGAGLGKVKVAVLSSSYIQQERDAVRKLGAMVHLQKPIRPDDCAAMVREIGRLLLPSDQP